MESREENTKLLHTPLPWRVDTPATSVVLGADGIDVALTFAGCGLRESETDDANAAFIVRACNSFDELLEVCRAFEKHLDTCAVPIEVEEKLRAALQNAKGGAD